MTASLKDRPDLSQWQGKRETVDDLISQNLSDRIAATLATPAPRLEDALPPLWHWAYFQQPLPAAGLGTDGHAARGGFLPPAAGRNRMWAGGEVEFLLPLQVGQVATRQTTIEAVSEKTGRTGDLLFVTLRHDYFQHQQLVIREKQDIVYRAPSPPKTHHNGEIPPAQWRQTVLPDATLLFRYSAVTFNGHRIHYDYPYATEVEGYTGLVVHGPLLATLAVQAFAVAHPEAVPRRLVYRGLRPLTVPDAFEVAGCVLESGKAQLWAANEQGMAQQAELWFESR